jgi:hypothetical protein
MADRRDAVAEWIGDHWEELAASAYAGYLQDGRGVCVILGKPCQGKACTFQYLGERNETGRMVYRDAFGSQFLHSEVAGRVKVYDPERDFLVLYIWEDMVATGLQACAVDDLPTPPEAWARQKNAAN